MAVEEVRVSHFETIGDKEGGQTPTAILQKGWYRMALKSLSCEPSPSLCFYGGFRKDCTKRLNDHRLATMVKRC